MNRASLQAAAPFPTAASAGRAKNAANHQLPGRLLRPRVLHFGDGIVRLNRIYSSEIRGSPERANCFRDEATIGRREFDEEGFAGRGRPRGHGRPRFCGRPSGATLRQGATDDRRCTTGAGSTSGSTAAGDRAATAGASPTIICGAGRTGPMVPTVAEGCTAEAAPLVGGQFGYRWQARLSCSASKCRATGRASRARTTARFPGPEHQLDHHQRVRPVHRPGRLRHG